MQQAVIIIIVLAILISYEAVGFNLDTVHSIIYEDSHKHMGIVTDKDNFFGYTIALYHGRRKPYIFIGAPRGVDTSMPSLNPGVVFKCGLKQQCEMLSLDNEHGNTAYRGDNVVEFKDNAWIGGTIDINTDANVLVICGFRWTFAKISGNGRSMIGVCYLSNLNDNIIQFEKLLPLMNSSKATMRYKDSSVYFYYLGEAGFSADLTAHKQHPELILGAPGLLNWYGGSALYTNIKSPHPLNPKISRQQNTKFALFGYAVSSGRYTGSKDVYYATSAPKANGYVGSVIIYKFGLYNDSMINVKYMLYGTQFGEYFGAALMSGDLNDDGYDDLVIGAPFYSKVNFNEGRIHIYYGGKVNSNFNDKEGVVHIEGTSCGGQFGTAISYLGDLNLDGYGDVAVGAPYSDNHRGKVYIYHGSNSGLITTPSQVLEASEIDMNLRGFGISISNAVDMDGNRFPDIAIGCHLSGHAVVIRSNPIVSIQTSLQIVNGTKINVGSTTILHCYNHTGSVYMSKTVSVRRTLTIDENYQRLILEGPTSLERALVLHNDCESFVLTTREKLYFLMEPVKVIVGYELIEEPKRKSNYYVGINNTDTFCKTCPILSTQPYETEFFFELGCGEDDVCTSNLNFDAIFYALTIDGSYVIGSKDFNRMDIQVTNSGDSAYLTQVFVTLPQNVKFVNSIPNRCEEDDNGILGCLMGNPLNNHAHISIFLNLKDVRIAQGPSLTFEVNVTTSSDNRNPQRSKQFSIPLKNVVDLQLMAKTISPLSFYTENASFTQVYEIQKLGDSPAEQVMLSIHLPTHILHDNMKHPIVKFYTIIGLLSGQPVHCKNITEVDYITDPSSDTPTESDLVEVDENLSVIRRRRSIDDIVNTVYSNNLNQSTTTENPVIIPKEDSTDCKFNSECVSLSCSVPGSGVICSPFHCDFGTIRSVHDIGVVKIKAFLNTTLIKKIVAVNEIVISGFGQIDAAIDLDSSNNNANVTNRFLDGNEYRIDMWILVCATIAGLLILLIFTFALNKAGFFTRKKKLQMEEEKKQVVSMINY